MKEYWYLVSSLPLLRFGEKPPMSVEMFHAAYTGHLSEEDLSVVEAVLENREPLRVGVASSWWNGEVQLRNAVVRVRAKNAGIDSSRFLQLHAGFSVSIGKKVADAWVRPNPLEQEAELDRARWALAEELALTGPFAFPGILAFAVKVRIAERWAELDDEIGRAKVEELILASVESREPITDNG